MTLAALRSYRMRFALFNQAWTLCDMLKIRAGLNALHILLAQVP
jgi:hypothetical protein